MLPRHARCVLSRLRCNGHSLLLSFFISSGLAESRIHSAALADTRPRIPLISLCTVQLRILCFDRSLATLSLFSTSGPDLEEFPSFWGSMVFRHAPSLGRGRVTTITAQILDVHQPLLRIPLNMQIPFSLLSLPGHRSS